MSLFCGLYLRWTLHTQHELLLPASIVSRQAQIRVHLVHGIGIACRPSCLPNPVTAAPRPESPLRRLSEEELRHEGSGETDSTRDGSTFDGSQASPARGTKRWWKGKFFRAKRRNSGNSGSGAAGTRSPVFTRVPRGVASSPGVPYQVALVGVYVRLPSAPVLTVSNMFFSLFFFSFSYIFPLRNMLLLSTLTTLAITAVRLFLFFSLFFLCTRTPV